VERDEPAERSVQDAATPWKLAGSDSRKPAAVKRRVGLK